MTPESDTSDRVKADATPSNDDVFKRLCTAVDWGKADQRQGPQPLSPDSSIVHSAAFSRSTSQRAVSAPFRRRVSTEEEAAAVQIAGQDLKARQLSTQRTCFPTKAWLYPELPWGAPPSWRQKNMRGKYFLTIWDIVMFFSCLYVAAAVPYVICFERPEGCLFYAEGTGWLYIFATVELLIDALFFVDIVITFCTARWFISSDGTPHWELVEDLRTIRTIYFKGAFLSDLLGQIPWQYMDCIAPHVDNEVKLLRLFRLFKLLRLRRLRRLLQAAYTQYPHSELVIASWQLVLTMVVGAHWMACIWYMIGKPDGWVLDEGLVDDNGNLLAGMDSYAWVTSFYWAVTTMSTIGYGDISAVTERERLVASFVMFMGCGLFAWTTSKLTSVLTKTSICEAQFNTKMEELNEYMAARALPQPLINKTQSFYMLKFPTRRIWNEDQILQDLPVELRKEIFLELFRDIVAMSPLFNACSIEVQREVCYRMRPIYKEGGRWVMRAGEVPGALYIVRHGKVKIESKGETLMVAGRGAIFGENALLGLTQDFKRTRSATTLTLCELCMLEANDLHELLVQNQEFHQVVSRMTKRFVHWLDVAVSEGRSLTQSDLLCVDWHLMSKHIEVDVANQKRRASAISVEDICELDNTQQGLSNHGQNQQPLGKNINSGSRHLFPRMKRKRIVGTVAVPPLDLTSMNPKPIRTLLTIGLHELLDLPQRGRSYSPFITVQWDGALGHPAAEQLAETSMFQLEKGGPGRVPVDKTVTLALLHQNNAWDSMPPLVITVWRLKSDMHEKLARSGTFRGDRSFGPQTGSKKGLFAFLDSQRNENEQGAVLDGFEDCARIWEGSISLQTLIENRLTRHRDHGDIVVTLEPMDSTASHGRAIDLSMDCKAVRVLWKDSRWHSLLPAFRAKGRQLASRYFQEGRRKAVDTIAGAVWSFDSAVQKERRHREALAWAQRLIAFDAPEPVAASEAVPGASAISGPHHEQPRTPATSPGLRPLSLRPLSKEEQFDGVSMLGRHPSVELQAQRRKVTRRMSADGIGSPGVKGSRGGGDSSSAQGAGRVRRWVMQPDSPMSIGDNGNHAQHEVGPSSVEKRTLQGRLSPQRFFGEKEGFDEEYGTGLLGGSSAGSSCRKLGRTSTQEARMEEMVAAMSTICDRAVKKATSLAASEVRVGMTGLMRSMLRESAISGEVAEEAGRRPISPLPRGGSEEVAEDSGRLMSATKVLRHASNEHAAGVGNGVQLESAYRPSVGNRAREMRRRCDTVPPDLRDHSAKSSPRRSSSSSPPKRASSDFLSQAPMGRSELPGGGPEVHQLDVGLVRKDPGRDDDFDGVAENMQDDNSTLAVDTGAGVQAREHDAGDVEISMAGETKTVHHQC